MSFYSSCMGQASAYTWVENCLLCVVCLQELADAVGRQSQQLAELAQQLLLGLLQSQKQKQQQLTQDVPASTVALLASLCDRHRMAVSSLMMATAPFTLPGECSAIQLPRHVSAGSCLSIGLT
jgi:hypothetical protein